MTAIKVMDWGMRELAPLEGDPFGLSRSSCLHAAQIALDVTINQEELSRFAANLDIEAVNKITEGSMGENCDTSRDDFHDGDMAANFALTFCLLQFGHGYRYALHRYCQRGASKTITQGVRSLSRQGPLTAARLKRLNREDICQAFLLPDNPDLCEFIDQLQVVVAQAGNVLEALGSKDFASFCRDVSHLPAAQDSPAANLVQQLAYHFPAFNDQSILHDGTRAVLVKKATLAIGELNRLATPFDTAFDFTRDYDQAIAPMDNVIPAVLVYHGVIQLSSGLNDIIHKQRAPLKRGAVEAELRAVALIACEHIVAATGRAVSPINLGYYLWKKGKEPGVRQFARHHTPDTIFY